MERQLRVGAGFNTSFRALHSWLGAFLVMALLYLAILGLVKGFWVLFPLLLPVIAGGLLVLKPALDCGLTYAAFRAHDTTGPVEVGDLFRGFDYLASAVPATVLMILFQTAAALPGAAMVAGGIAVLVLEGPVAVGVVLIVLGSVALLAGIVVIATFYVFVYQAIVDTKATWWEAMEHSRKLAFANFGAAVGTLFLATLMEVVGYLMCCVGILYTLPLRYTFVTSVYRTAVGAASLGRPRRRGRRTSNG
ncbi:MAG: hypothetical protein ONB14_05275 [candidate division KSB1 bacterium]|nr:hypothetical protein [candidate division KSB1 bacterium]